MKNANNKEKRKIKGEKKIRRSRKKARRKTMRGGNEQG